MREIPGCFNNLTHDPPLLHLLQLQVERLLERAVQAEPEGDAGGEEALGHHVNVVVRDPGAWGEKNRFLMEFGTDFVAE